MGLITGIQIIGVFFGLFMAYYTFVNFKKQQIKSTEFGLWIVLWFLFIFASLKPDVLKLVAHSLQVYRTMDFLTIVAFFFVILITFHNYLMTKKNAQKIDEIVRRVAIKRAIKKTKRRK